MRKDESKKPKLPKNIFILERNRKEKKNWSPNFRHNDDLFTESYYNFLTIVHSENLNIRNIYDLYKILMAILIQTTLFK